jgi:hypothetical protein
MHVRARSRKSCCTGRIGGLIVGGIMVGSTEGPVSLRAAECGRWLKTPFLVAHTCSGLQTVGDGLANSSISQPTIIANKQGSWLTIIANGPTLVCE